MALLVISIGTCGASAARAMGPFTYGRLTHGLQHLGLQVVVLPRQRIEKNRLGWFRGALAVSFNDGDRGLIAIYDVRTTPPVSASLIKEHLQGNS
ncbi:hypothetical protein AKJ16_DCAP22632 [Drosera capensis]